MSLEIKTVGVLGTGVMGAQIAAHLTNAKITVLAFDIDQATAAKGIKEAQDIKPAAFYNKKTSELITPLNYDDHIDRISECDSGVLVYLRQEGRGIGLKNKILAYQLQDKGLDTVEANEELGFSSDLREYGIGAQILKECGVKKMRLLTNNPKKIIGLEGYNLKIIGREPIEIKSNHVNKKYLKTKRDKLGHLLSELEK